MESLVVQPSQETLPAPVVFVVDDDVEVRTSLNQLLRSARLNVKTYISAFEFLDDYDPGVPGCLVLDVRMPGMSGLELQERLALKKIYLPVIIITGYGEVPMVVQAIQTGAFDFVQKPYPPNDLLRRIQQAVQLDVEQKQGIVPAHIVAARLSTLTPREQQVLDLLLEDPTDEDLAAQLDVTLKTAQFQRQNVFRKMEVTSPAQLRRLMFPQEEGAAGLTSS